MIVVLKREFCATKLHKRYHVCTLVQRVSSLVRATMNARIDMHVVENHANKGAYANVTKKQTYAMYGTNLHATLSCSSTP